MNENTLNLIRVIAEGDALETEKSFQAAMAEKISAKLEDMRAQIAQNMFTTPETVAEENEEEYKTISLEEYEALSEEKKAEYELVDMEEGVTDKIRQKTNAAGQAIGNIVGTAADVVKGVAGAAGKVVGHTAATAGVIRQTPAAVKNAYNKGRGAADKSIAG
jgi:hypothetical protein